MEEKSKILIAGENESECGYCHQVESPTAKTFGILSKLMYSDDYEAMMLKGWRRSGCYFYKPIMHQTCCPAYTIRLNVSSFLPSKAQRQVLRRCERYIQTGSVLESQSELGLTPKSYQIETVAPELTDERYFLYKKYQMSVHGDPESKITRDSFKNFLVDSPLKCRKRNIKPSGLSWGSYHQLHRIDGQLVAVGVVDLLPTGLSSVYFFYDPEFRHLALGKLSALKEIEFCREQGLEYYYMGFYIHSCPKMRYKAEFSPSELLCPARFSWQPLEECLPLLDCSSFSPLDPSLREKWVSSLPIPSSSSSSSSSSTLTSLASLISSLTTTSSSTSISPEFLPDFPVSPESALLSCQILLPSSPRPFIVDDFVPEGKEIVIDMIRKLESHCDSSLFPRFIFKLYN